MVQVIWIAQLLLVELSIQFEWAFSSESSRRASLPFKALNPSTAKRHFTKELNCFGDEYSYCCGSLLIFKSNFVATTASIAFA